MPDKLQISLLPDGGTRRRVMINEELRAFASYQRGSRWIMQNALGQVLHWPREVKGQVIPRQRRGPIGCQKLEMLPHLIKEILHIGLLPSLAELEAAEKRQGKAEPPSQD